MHQGNDFSDGFGIGFGERVPGRQEFAKPQKCLAGFRIFRSGTGHGPEKPGDWRVTVRIAFWSMNGNELCMDRRQSCVGLEFEEELHGCLSMEIPAFDEGEFALRRRQGRSVRQADLAVPQLVQPAREIGKARRDDVHHESRTLQPPAHGKKT